jgi:hypothetical protein
MPTINLEPDKKDIRGMLRVIQIFFTKAGNKGNAFSVLYDKLTLPEYGIGLKRGLIPIYIAVILSLNKQKLVIKHKDTEVRITPDLLNDINESPEEYTVIFEDWSVDKSAYLSGLERIFDKYVSEREKTYNGFDFLLLAMNRWYMNLPKYAKELNREYIGSGRYKQLDPHRKKFINSLKQLDTNSRDYLFEKVFLFFNMKFSPNILPLIDATKTEWDNAVSNLITVLINDVKKIFAKQRTRGSLVSAIKDWYESLSVQTRQFLFTGNENRILSLLSAISNDESAFIQRLAKAVTSLRIEDWNTETINVFLQELATFKKTVNDYNNKKQHVSGSNSYKIIFTDKKGNKTTKIFNKTAYSNKAKLLLNELNSAIEEMGQSITEREKRQVLIELLEKLC